MRELKLLVDHRDDLVAERRRAQQRLRWHLHELDPAFEVPLRSARPGRLARPGRPLARPPEQTVQVRIARELRRPLPHADPHDQRARPRARDANDSGRAGAARAARLRRRSPPRSCSARSAPSAASDTRRPTRPPRRRRPARGQLRQAPTPPTRPRRQPPTQLRPPPDRDHPSAHPPARPRLPGTQTGRREKPPRSHPLPQTTTRPHRLHHPQKRAPLDIGATLAQPTVVRPDGFRSWFSRSGGTVARRPPLRSGLYRGAWSCRGRPCWPSSRRRSHRC